MIKAKHVNSEGSGDFYWYGEVQKETTDSTAHDACDCYDGYVNFMKKGDKTIGDIYIDEDHYELEDLGEGRNLLVKKETDLGHKCFMPDDEAPDSLKVPNNPGSEKNLSNCPVKVLALYTDHAMDKVSNLEDKIVLFIKKTNQALRNSQVLEKELEFVLVGIQEIDFSDEYRSPNLNDDEVTKFMMNELLNINTNPVGDQIVDLRKSTDADIVILYSYADNGNNIGTSGSQFLDPDRAIILIAKGGYDNWTTAHELGHILGCFHEVGGPAVPSNATFEHAIKVDAGFCNWKERSTIVYSSSDVKTLGYYSNPNVKYKGEKLGTVDMRENWRALRDNACTVAGFRDSVAIGQLIVSWNAPFYACRCQEAGITTDVAGGDGTYGYKWYISNDGFNWGNVVSTNNYLSTEVPLGCPNPPLEHLFVKLEVESDGQVVVLTRRIEAVDQIPGNPTPCLEPGVPIKGPNTGNNSSYLVNDIESESLEIYPNPVSGEILIADKEGSNKDLHIEIYNAIGMSVYKAFIKEPVFPISIDLSHLSKGTYLLKINGSEVKKIIKQ